MFVCLEDKFLFGFLLLKKTFSIYKMWISLSEKYLTGTDVAPSSVYMPDKIGFQLYDLGIFV